MSEKPLQTCRCITNVLLPVLLAYLATCGALSRAQGIKIEGSAAGYGISRAAAAAFDSGKAIQVGVSGAALGFANLCRGDAQLIQSSRPIQKSEQAACAKAGMEFIEVPIAFDAVAVIVHPRNTFIGSVSLEELRGAWELKAQGRITRWSQVNPSWPDSPLQLIGPDRLSDEARFLTTAVLGGGVARQDYMSSTEDNVVVQAVARDPGTLGLVSLAYYLENRTRLKAVSVVFESGGPAVAPSLEAVARGEYRTLSRPVFLYVSIRALERPQVAQLAEFYVHNAGRFAKEQSYVALSASLYSKALANLRSRVKGSVWDGSVPIGLTPEALHKKYAVQ